MTDIDLSTIADEEWAGFVSLVYAEDARRTTKREAAADMERLASEYAAAVADDPAKDASTMGPTDTIGPGGHVIIDGVEWVNNTLAWLSPLSAGPADYPQGWRTAKEEDIPAADAWTIGKAYKVGDLVTFGGQSWRCLQAHTAQAGWEPLAVPALWARA